MTLPFYFNDKVVNNRKKSLSNMMQNCDKCNHTGYIETGDDMFVDCGCVKEFENIRKYLNCGLTENDIVTEDRLSIFTEPVLEKIRQMVSKIETYIGYSFFFYNLSKSAYGSDILAKYVYMKMCDVVPSCFTISMKQLIDIFFDFEDEKYAGCLEFLKSIRVLLITGMGAEYNPKMKTDDTFVVSSLSGFFSERNNNTTIISASFTKDTLYSTYSKELATLIAKDFLGFGVDTVKREETEYAIIRRKNLDIGFDDLSVVKPVRKKLLE